MYNCSHVVRIQSRLQGFKECVHARTKEVEIDHFLTRWFSRTIETAKKKKIVALGWWKADIGLKGTFLTPKKMKKDNPTIIGHF